MARKAFVLTNDEIIELMKHIQALPFKRKIEQRFFDILPGKKNIEDFSEEELILINKCRYEKNAYIKRMTVLEQIKSKDQRTKIEQEIVDLAQQTDIDSHFLKLDVLKNYLQQQNQKKLEIKLRNEKKRLEQKLSKPDPNVKKQRDRENYYLGAMCKKLFELTGFHADQPNDLKRLEQIFMDEAALAYFSERNQLSKEQKQRASTNHSLSERIKTITVEFESNTRNPFKTR